MKQGESKNQIHHHGFINSSFATLCDLCDLCAFAVEKTNRGFFEDGNHEMHEIHETEACGWGFCWEADSFGKCSRLEGRLSVLALGWGLAFFLATYLEKESFNREWARI